MNEDATILLKKATEGDQAAANRLTPLVYEELRALARKYMARGGPGGGMTLQPTALVHEAFLRLVDQDAAEIQGRTHFYALAAVAMRHALIDHARGKNRAKRGGDWQRITLTGAAGTTGRDEVDLLALAEALEKFAELDERAAKIVELRFFGGLKETEIATLLGVSERTVRNDWSMARAWLQCEMDATRGDATT